MRDTRADVDILDAYLTNNKPAHAQNSANAWKALPWRENTELRISPEVDVRDVTTQTYSVRARPIGKRERRTQASILSLEQRLAELEMNRLQGQFVETRYRTIIDLAARESQFALLHSELELTRASLAASLNAVGTQTRALDVQQLEGQLRLIERATSLARRNTVGPYFAININKRPVLYSSAAMIPPAEILRVAREINQLLPAGAPEVQYAAMEIERAKAERELDRTQTGFGLDLLEVSYENKGIDSYNLTLGWRIPTRRHSYSSRKRVQAISAAERRAELAAEMIGNQKTQLLQELEGLAFSFDHLAQAAVELHDRITGMGEDPETLLTFEERRLALAEDAAENHTRMLSTYVDYLAICGAFATLPERNWLKVR